MIIALTGAISPVLGGSLADFFAGKSILRQVNLHGFLGIRMLKLFELQNFGFLFLIGGLLAIGALMLLNAVKEEGATLKEKAMSEIKTGIRYKLKKGMQPEKMISALYATCHTRLQLHRRRRNRLGIKLFFR